MTYDENSFMLGLSVGKTMKGASYTRGRDLPDSYDGGSTLVRGPFVVSFAAAWDCCLVPAPIVCTWGAA